jgi:hypothetical protein
MERLHLGLAIAPKERKQRKSTGKVLKMKKVAKVKKMNRGVRSEVPCLNQPKEDRLIIPYAFAAFTSSPENDQFY